MASTDNSKMETLFEEVKALASGATTETRLALMKFARDLEQSVETPADTLQRISWGYVPSVITELGIRLQVFQKLSESTQPLNDTELAKFNNADPYLTSRITRCLASYGMIKETSHGHYAANHITKTLAREDFQGAFHHMYYVFYALFKDMPNQLEESGWQNPTDSTDVSFQRVFETDLPFYRYAQTDTEMLRNASLYMRVWREGVPSWLDVYPIEAEAKDLTSNDVLFADIGGGFGQQCRAVIQKLPNLSASVVLQDLPETLSNAPAIDGVEHMAQDFFQPQALKAARLYYLRNILHDYPDDKCLIILGHLAEVIRNSSHSSKILVDEISLPPTGAHHYATQLDLAMLACFAAIERTEAQWSILFKKCGLKINRHFKYDKALSMTIMEVVLI